MKMKSSFAFVLAAIALSLTACGKDQTPDEYQRQRLQESLEVYEAISGTYTGNLVNLKTQKSIGALQLDLSAEANTVNQTTGEVTAGAPALVTNVTYRDQSSLNFRIDSGFYNPDTGEYRSSMEVKNDVSGDTSSKMFIKGMIRDGKFTGTIAAANSPQGSVYFELRLNGTPIDKIRQGAPKGPYDEMGVTREYSGKGLWPDGSGKEKMRKFVLHVDKPIRPPEAGGPAGDFMDILNPDRIRLVNASIEFSDLLTLGLDSVRWDPSAGTLNGINNRVTGSEQVIFYLNCVNFHFTEQSTPFSCVYKSNRSKPIKMEFNPPND